MGRCASIGIGVDRKNTVAHSARCRGGGIGIRTRLKSGPFVGSNPTHGKEFMEEVNKVADAINHLSSTIGWCTFWIIIFGFFRGFRK